MQVTIIWIAILNTASLIILPYNLMQQCDESTKYPIIKLYWKTVICLKSWSSENFNGGSFPANLRCVRDTNQMYV